MEKKTGRCPKTLSACPARYDRHDFMAGHYFLFHNYLAPSALRQEFSINPYYPGLLLLFETAESEGEVPVFREQRNLAKTYQVSRNELRLLQLETAGEISEAIAQGRTRQIMHTIDLQLEHRLRDLALRIQKDDDIRLILVAGPSSSGKTTFSKKLSSHLRALGKRPITLSMDDYFIDRAHTPWMKTERRILKPQKRSIWNVLIGYAHLIGRIGSTDASLRFFIGQELSGRTDFTD